VPSEGDPLNSDEEEEDAGVKRVELSVSAALKKRKRTSTPPHPS